MKPLAEQNLYEILEVAPDAPEEVIVQAWDRVSALCAPGALATYTLLPADEAALLGRRLEEALTVLLDPVERQRYDAQLSPTPAPRAGSSNDATSGEVRTTRRLPPVIPARTLPPVIRAVQDPPPGPAVEPTAAVSAREPTAAAESPIALQRLADAASPIPLVTPVPMAPLATPLPFAALTALATEAATPAPPAPAPAAAAPPPPPALVVDEATRFDGEMLRRAREARGVTLPQLCERTKITRHHVENVEADRYDKLPAPVYLRGILMAIARELRLDGQKVARSYLEGMGAGPGAATGTR